MAGMPKYASRAERFAAEYTVDLNASAAARRVGYAKGSAGEVGWWHLKRPAVRQAIALRTQRLFAHAGVPPERVLAELARIAFTGPQPLVRDDGTPRTVDEIDDDALATVRSIELEDGNRRRVLRLWPFDRLKALKLLGDYFDLFETPVGHPSLAAWSPQPPRLAPAGAREGGSIPPDPRTARFIDEYKIDLNANAAARRAGYGPRGTGSKAMRLMWQPDVRAAVEGHMANLCGDLERTAQRTIEAAVRIAFADLRGVFRTDGTAKDMKEIDDDAMAGLAHFGPVVKSCRPVFKVIRQDKLAALGLLLRYVKLFSPRVGMNPN